MNQNEQPDKTRVFEAPTPEQMRKGHYVFSKSAGRFRLAYHSNLEKYYGSGSLDADQYRAGDRLYQDAYHGGVLSQIKGIDTTKAAMPRDENARTGEMSSDRAWTHKSFSDAFFHELMTQEYQNILWWVCICDNTTSTFGKNRSHTIGLLREALNVLVHVYKLR